MATQTLDIERELSRDEKSGTMHSEHMGGLAQQDADFLNNFPEERKKAVIRKVDVSLSKTAVNRLVLLTQTDAAHPYARTLVLDSILGQDKHWYALN